MSEQPTKTGLRASDIVILLGGIVAWLFTFLLGTFVDSAPYRDAFSTFEGGAAATLKNGALVVATYTLTNVAILCLIACLLGTLAAKAQLGTDVDVGAGGDRTAPLASGLLRGFMVYLCLVAGVLILGEDPAAPTQRQYVRLAGLMSLVGFIINYQPALFGRLLRRVGTLVESGGNASDAKPGPRDPCPDKPR